MITTKRVFHGAPEVPLDKNVLVSVARSQSYRLILHHILKNFMLCIIRNIADKIYDSRKSRKLLKQCFTSFFSRNPSILLPFYIQLFNFKTTPNNFDNKIYKFTIRFHTTFFKVGNKFFKCRISSWNCGSFTNISADDCGCIFLQ